MVVKNYYKMPKSKLDESLKFVQAWLFDNPKSEHREKVRLALDIILDSYRVYDQLETDLFLRDVVDNLM